MKKPEAALLALLRAALHEEKPVDPELTVGEWETLLRLADVHKLLPLVLDSSCKLSSLLAIKRGCENQLSSDGSAAYSRKDDADSHDDVPRGTSAGPGPGSNDCLTKWKNHVLAQVGRQAIQENEFLNLILELRARGLEPLVLKGPICRALYPKPLLRPSVDDDLLIPDAQGPAFHAALLELGLTADDPGADPENGWELSYHMPGSPLYIELHKRLFDPESEVFGACNKLFSGALDRTVSVRIQDVSLRTLAPTDHLLFLLLHAFKHFLHSGFGLRIVSDICLFTDRFWDRIDFTAVLEGCARLRADRFAAAVYRIGKKYLNLRAPALFDGIETDETALLEDVLASGLHGTQIDRLHSANITLGAVRDSKQGRSASGGLRHTLFPPAKELTGVYPFLDHRPWLLPVAWLRRVGDYARRRKRYGSQSPTAPLRIGKERIRLLQTYGVID